MVSGLHRPLQLADLCLQAKLRHVPHQLIPPGLCIRLCTPNTWPCTTLYTTTARNTTTLYTIVAMDIVQHYVYNSNGQYRTMYTRIAMNVIQHHCTIAMEIVQYCTHQQQWTLYNPIHKNSNGECRTTVTTAMDIVQPHTQE